MKSRKYCDCCVLTNIVISTVRQRNELCFVPLTSACHISPCMCSTSVLSEVLFMYSYRLWTNLKQQQPSAGFPQLFIYSRLILRTGRLSLYGCIHPASHFIKSGFHWCKVSIEVQISFSADTSIISSWEHRAIVKSYPP